jgi:transcriptional regulator
MLAMLVLRVLRNSSMHGYAIAQRIRQLSDDVLQVEEGSLYPALQRMLLKGWVTSEWGTSDTGRRVRFYRLTASGRKQLQDQVAQHDLIMQAIQVVLRTA